MKICIISLFDDESERVKLKAYAKREDAIAEMEDIAETFDRRLRHTIVHLEKVDDLLVVAFYGEDESIRCEKAVMTEIDVIETSDQKELLGYSILNDNGWQHEEIDGERELPW